MAHIVQINRRWVLATLLLMTMTACGAPNQPTNPSSDAGASSSPTGGAASPAPAGTTTTGDGHDALAGEWRLVRFGPPSQPLTPDGDGATLTFGADGTVGGSGGCNSFGGSYTAGGTAMAISQLVSTERACADSALMAQEAQYLAALGTVSEFVLADGALTLRYAGGELVFEPVAAEPAAQLEQTTWHFDGFTQGAVVTMPDGGQQITATLRDGTLSGNGGCNGYSGSATIQGQQLTVGPLISTKMACPALATETQFLGALQSATGWEIVGRRLTIRYPAGALQFVAEP